MVGRKVGDAARKAASRPEGRFAAGGSGSARALRAVRRGLAQSRRFSAPGRKKGTGCKKALRRRKI